jgi:hypothetical protein
VLQSKQVGNWLDGQHVGVEVDDFGELSEPERVKFGESRSKVRSSYKRGLELTSSKQFDINWVGFEESSISPRIFERSDGGRDTHR